MFIMLVISTMCIGFVSCGGDDDDNGGGGTLPNPDTTERLAGSRLHSINGMPITYDDNNEIVSIYTSRWGNVRISFSVTFNGNYLSQYSDGERTSVAWSGGNPVKSSGKEFVSQATYGEQCSDKAFCMAFNLYAMLYGDVYKPHILGILYGHSYYNKLGVNANQLVTHVDYHETDDSEYDDMSVDFDYQKDAQGNVTLVTYHIKTTSYKNGEVLSSGEKTETISLVWEEFKTADNYDGTLYYTVVSGTEAQVSKARKDCSSVAIPNDIKIDGKTYSVTSIGKSAFAGNDKLKSVIFPDNLTSIGDSAFYKCSGLTAISLPDKLKILGTGCFSGTSLTSVDIPQGVKEVKGFDDCKNLKSVTLPNDLTVIGYHAFTNCSSLSKMQLPATVTKIDVSAFEGCSGLESINIPQTVTELGMFAFDGCSSLVSITIPEKITVLQRGTFSGCNKLKEIDVPEGVTIIWGFAFADCTNLEKVTLPSTVTDIGELAFRGATSLKNFYCYAKQVPKFNSSLFYSNNIFENAKISGATLHVPNASLDLYSKTYPWSAFGSIVRTE